MGPSGGSPDPGEPRVPSPARRSFKSVRAAGSYSRPAWPVLQHIPPIYKRRTKHPPRADLRLGNSLSAHGTLSLATFCLALPALTPRLQVTTPSGTCLDAAGQLPALDAGPRTSPARRPSLPPSNSPQFPSTHTGRAQIPRPPPILPPILPSSQKNTARTRNRQIASVRSFAGGAFSFSHTPFRVFGRRPELAAHARIWASCDEPQGGGACRRLHTHTWRVQGAGGVGAWRELVDETVGRRVS